MLMLLLWVVVSTAMHQQENPDRVVRNKGQCFRWADWLASAVVKPQLEPHACP